MEEVLWIDNHFVAVVKFHYDKFHLAYSNSTNVMTGKMVLSVLATRS